MNILIPYSGLKLGIHQFTYILTSSFFKQFENTPVGKAKYKLELTFDRRPDMFVLDFKFLGKTKTPCDRCNEVIELKMKGKERLIVKIADEPREFDGEIMYIARGGYELDITDVVYDMLVLAIPMRKSCLDTEEGLPSCGKTEIMNFFVNDQEPDTDQQNEEDESKSSIWDALKSLKDNNQN